MRPTENVCDNAHISSAIIIWSIQIWKNERLSEMKVYETYMWAEKREAGKLQILFQLVPHHLLFYLKYVEMCCNMTEKNRYVTRDFYVWQFKLQGNEKND